MNTLTLHPDERELRRWRISPQGFALRTAVLFLTTLFCLSPLTFFVSISGLVIASTVLSLLYMWIFDDFLIWRNNRNTLWLLSDRALYIHGPDAPEPVDHRLPLTEITKINRFPLWSLVLRLKPGTAITLPLVPTPRAIRAEIISARDEALKGI
ncbi:MAG: hypothetical protein ABJL99_13565 [Aliishimia sp.]